MARENEPDAAAAEDEPATKGRAEGKTFLVIAIAIVLVALGSGAALAYVFYPRASQLVFGTTPDPDEPKPIEYGQFMKIDNIIVNPADSGGKRFLMVNVGIEGANADVLAAVTSKEIVIRDRILRLLAGRSTSYLADISKRDSIKTQLLTELNGVLDTEKISRLYFTQYVLQ